MSDAALQVEAIGKRYAIGAIKERHDTLRDQIAAVASRAGRPFTGLGRGPAGARENGGSHIWALRDVSFEVERGEAVGIIGANGAGKSTLLKLLCRITEPTEGQAVIRGRVASILEVGTGFHPELTGRENIFLNGAILGMKQAEIRERFDEIVAFAEVEKFLDTPVKRYSSGMYVRLAFAVAAHLSAEIMLVDEVLAVGDFGFQRRCLGKIEEQTSREGRSVLFVSHNLGAVKILTERCLWLEGGHVRALGPTEEVVRDYVLSYRSSGSGLVDLSDLRTGRTKWLPQDVAFVAIELLDREGTSTDSYLEDDPVRVRVRLRTRAALRDIRLEVICRVFSLEGVLIFTVSSGPSEVELEPGLFEISFAVDPNPLRAGSYRIDLYALTMSDRVGDKGQDMVASAIGFIVEENPASRELVSYSDRGGPGLVRVGHEAGRFTPVVEHEPQEPAEPAPHRRAGESELQ